MENCAEPVVRALLPIWVWPSRNVAVPVGVPCPDCGKTFAVNVTLAPELICVAETVSAVAVPSFGGAETVTETAFDVEVAKVESPE